MGASIALGLTNNIDYEIVWDPHVFNRKILEFGLKPEDIRDVKIQTERDLIISVLYFMSEDKGGERYVHDLGVIIAFSNLFDFRITMGGTSARAAIAISKLGYESALHTVTNNDHVRFLIPDNCQWICSNDNESIYPHLVIQFNRNEKITIGDRTIETTKPNRLLFYNDVDNYFVKINEKFCTLAGDADVFLISGLNSIQDKNILDIRLNSVLRIVGTIRNKPVVVFEESCFQDFELHDRIRGKLLKIIDVYSLNEDEMQEYLERKIDLNDANDVWNSLNELYSIFSSPVIMVHTRYWALAFGKDAYRYSEAIKGGIALATTRFRKGDDFNISDYEQTEKLPLDEGGSKFAADISSIGNDSIFCQPAFSVTQKKVTTVGLGDAFIGGFIAALSDSISV